MGDTSASDESICRARVVRWPTGVCVSWRWFGEPAAVGGAALAMFVGAVAYGTGEMAGNYCNGAVIVIGVYWLSAQCLNRTIVTASRSQIRVWHGPVPWPGSKMLRADAVTRVYAKIHVALSGGSQADVSFAVQVVDQEHRDVTLVSGIYDEQIADLVVHELRKALRRPEDATLP